jgi:hypothetical protein
MPKKKTSLRTRRTYYHHMFMPVKALFIRWVPATAGLAPVRAPAPLPPALSEDCGEILFDALSQERDGPRGDSGALA